MVWVLIISEIGSLVDDALAVIALVLPVSDTVAD
jgi:hypothetical protein